VLALRPRGLDPGARARAVAEARRHLGKPYDAAFGWSDDRLYCSELVRKAYARGAGVELGRMERLGDLAVGGLERELAARFSRVPRDLELVTPASLAADPRLEPVEAR
jgi:cell wall-associated NlpC family hydrolase